MFLKKLLIYLLFVLNLGVVFYFWGSQSGALLFDGNTYDLLLSLGRICALLAVFFILLQLILIGRVAWVERLFGLDHLSRVHHWNGHLSFVFLIAHPILITYAYTAGKQTFFSQFGSMIFGSDDLLQAAIAVVLIIVIIGTSITIARRKLKYESWYYVHLGTYLAIILAYGHQLELGGDFSNNLFVYYWYALYTFAFGNLILFRFGRPLYNFYKHRFYVDRIERETHDTVSIYMSGKNLSRFHVRGGQFMIFRFLAKGFWWQAHPFSYSTDPGTDSLRITVKRVGDFTAQLPHLKPGTQVLIEGPNGIFTTQNCKRNTYLFIAGGVGITPIRSIIGGLVDSGKADDIVLLYGNKSSRDIIFKEELEKLEHDGPLRITHIMSSDPDWKHETGKIDLEKIQKLVPDFREREIFVCGPPIMMRSIVKACKNAHIPRKQIHFEKFSL